MEYDSIAITGVYITSLPVDFAIYHHFLFFKLKQIELLDTQTASSQDPSVSS